MRTDIYCNARFTSEESKLHTKDQSAPPTAVQRRLQGGLGIVGSARRIQILSSRIRLARRATALRRGRDRQIEAPLGWSGKGKLI